MTSRLSVDQLRTPTRELDLGEARVFHMPDWHKMTHPERLVVMRQIAEMRGRDPSIAKLALSIIKKSGARPRQYEKQAQALLAWVQNPKNVFYINEPGERLQDPLYTIRVGHGDCDDQVTTLCALFESVGLPWRQVLSGLTQDGNKVRYIEGDTSIAPAQWTHIYCMVGTPPFNPTTWYFCEPTVEGVPLGWDVIDGDHRYLPEMTRPMGEPQIVPAPRAGMFMRPTTLPPYENRSPAYYMAGPEMRTNNSVSTAVGASVAAQHSFNWKEIGLAVLTGVAVSVGTQITLDWLRGRGIWEGHGHVIQRWTE